MEGRPVSTTSPTHDTIEANFRGGARLDYDESENAHVFTKVVVLLILAWLALAITRFC